MGPPRRRLTGLLRQLSGPTPPHPTSAAGAAGAGELFVNPRWAQAEAEFSRSAHNAAISREDVAAARAEVESWQGYEPTPLLPVELAERLGVASVHCKHEGYRFQPVGSFKPTGVVYGLARVLLSELQGQLPAGAADGAASAAAVLLGGGAEAAAHLAQVTVCAATSGNHGRALAWGAQLFGCRCVIYMGEGVSQSRQTAIESFGAEVVRVGGSYDDVVAKSESDAAEHGYFVISNVAYPGVDVPNLIMHGYACTGDEIATQLGEDDPPTHVFICGGGGRFGAGVATALWQRYGAARPKCVMVEPIASAALQASAKQGEPVAVEPGASLMDGLVVESASKIGYPVLHDAAFAFLSVPDTAAVDAMQLLAGLPQPIPVGETGIAGWAGLCHAAADPSLREALGLDEDSRVVVVATEGPTDPEVYEEVVGSPPAPLPAP